MCCSTLKIGKILFILGIYLLQLGKKTYFLALGTTPVTGVGFIVRIRYILRIFKFSDVLRYFQYEEAEEVVLWMNTVGPYHNRQETYSFFSLPFCAGPKESISHYHETLGEALQGTELEFSGLDIDYKSKFSYSFMSV